jgi:branched-chain amino acid transport system permease protein
MTTRMTNSRKALLGIVSAVALALPWMIGAYRLQIFIFVITYSMLALAFTLSWKVGLPRFDIAAWWGVGAYTSAMLMLKLHMSFWWTVPISATVSLVLGYLVFSMSVRRGMMVFMMFGMVFAIAIQQVLGTVKWFGGWGGTASLPPITFAGHALSSKMPIYYFGLGLLVFSIVVYQLLYKSKIGRAWDAIGTSTRLGSSLGIDVVKYRLVNVLIGNVFLAVAGSFSVVYSAMVIPSSFGFNRSIYVIMYVLLGGFGYVLAGPIVGALVLTVLAESLRPAQQYEAIITGALTILIIVFAPTGLLGLFEKRLQPLAMRIPGVGPLLGKKTAAARERVSGKAG